MVRQGVIAVESVAQTPLRAQRPGTVAKINFQPEPARRSCVVRRRIGRRQAAEVGRAHIGAQVTDSAYHVRGEQAVRKEVADNVETQLQVFLAREAVDIVVAEQTFQCEALAHFPANLDLQA